jgi:hypothetical protein
MLLWLVTVAAPVLPETSGMQISIDLKVILQTVIAGLLVWSLSLVRESRLKLAASVTKMAVMEEQLKNIKEDVDILVERGNAKTP